jgi:hypothetical protein
MDPTGMWNARVVRPKGTTSGTFVFASNGTALLVDGGIGGGTWDTTGPQRFTFRLAEPRFDDEGGYLGWVAIEQDAVVDADTFTSLGVTTVYDASGTAAYSAQVSISAVRQAA